MMESAVPRPDTVTKLRYAADAAFAMLAGMQLDVFTPLKAGPQTAEEIAHALGVSSTRLRLVLYSLAAAGLLTEKHGRFSNTPEADQFLVKGGPSYIGDWHATFSNRWVRNLKIAESIRAGGHRRSSTSPSLHRRSYRNTFDESTCLPLQLRRLC